MPRHQPRHLPRPESYRRRTVRLAAGLACAAALTAGCSTESLMEEGLERAVEQGASGDADVEFDGEGRISVEHEDGSFQMGSDELPEGFPTEEVPLPEGDVLTSSRFIEGDDTVWSVTLRTGGEAASAFTRARDELTTAGYDETQAVDSGSFRSATLEDTAFRVNLTALEGPDGATLSYTVTSGAP